jgi:hypothetical protein
LAVVERYEQLGADLPQRKLGVQEPQDSELAFAEVLAGGSRRARRGQPGSVLCLRQRALQDPRVGAACEELLGLRDSVTAGVAAPERREHPSVAEGCGRTLEHAGAAP